MWRGLSIRCKIASCVAVFFLGVAGLCFFSVFMSRAYFRSRARFCCLMAIRVDFSAPGTYSSSINSKPHYLENTYLYLDVPKQVLSKTDPKVLLSGLKGTYEIIDTDGKRIFGGSLITDPNNLKSRHFKNLIELIHHFEWYEFVQWQINITITQGAAQLKDIPQQLILFDLSHNYMMQEDLRKLFGWANLILAVTILIIVAIVSFRKRKLIECSKKTSGTATSSPPVSEEQL